MMDSTLILSRLALNLSPKVQKTLLCLGGWGVLLWLASCQSAPKNEGLALLDDHENYVIDSTASSLVWVGHFQNGIKTDSLLIPHVSGQMQVLEGKVVSAYFQLNPAKFKPYNTSQMIPDWVSSDQYLKLGRKPIWQYRLLLTNPYMTESPEAIADTLPHRLANPNLVLTGAWVFPDSSFQNTFPAIGRSINPQTYQLEARFRFDTRQLVMATDSTHMTLPKDAYALLKIIAKKKN